jgi:zinc protease
VSERLFKEAFTVHGYGRPTIGWMEDIERLGPEDCQQFYSTYYAPNNATIVVVGDVDREKLIRLVADKYGAISASELPVEDCHPEPPQTAERRVAMIEETPTPKLAIGYKCPAMGDYDHAPLVMLSEILFGGRSSRGYRRLVHDLELASEAGASVGNFRDPSLFEVMLTAREEVPPERLLAELDCVLDEAALVPPRDDEIARARARLELGTLQGMQTMSGKAEQMGFCEIVLGDPAAPWSRLDAYGRVTRSDLLRVARRYLRPEGRTVVIVEPDAASPPDSESDDSASGDWAGDDA